MDLSRMRMAVYTGCIAFLAAVFWNFVPMFFVVDMLSDTVRNIWIWGVFPISIPLFYVFLYRHFKRQTNWTW